MHIWVVEKLVGEIWQPTELAACTRWQAQIKMQENTTVFRQRIRKYAPALAPWRG